MTATVSRPITAEEFSRLPAQEGKVELLHGEVIYSMTPGGLHGGLALGIGALLRQFARRQGGYAGVEAGFLLQRAPDVVRLPDVAFVSREHIPSEGVPETLWNQCPDVAIEVISPSELATDIEEKISLYLMAGTEQVWTVYPRQKRVTVHTADHTARTLQAHEMLEGSGVLEGFRCQVAELFEL